MTHFFPRSRAPSAEIISAEEMEPRLIGAGAISILLCALEPLWLPGPGIFFATVLWLSSGYYGLAESSRRVDQMTHLLGCLGLFLPLCIAVPLGAIALFRSHDAMQKLLGAFGAVLGVAVAFSLAW